jgi:hypothetical protein
VVAAFCLWAHSAFPADGCGSLSSTRAIIARIGGGALVPLESGLADDLRVADFPLADEVLGSALPSGELAVVYVRNDRACGVRFISQTVLFALAALRSKGESPAGPSF